MFAKFCAPTEGTSSPFFYCSPTEAVGDPIAELKVERFQWDTCGFREEGVAEFRTVDELLDLRAALDATIDYLQRSQEPVSS